MGQRPGEVEQDIRQTRETISRKLDEMTQRGKDDVGAVSGRVQEFFQSSPVNQAVDSQPLLTVLGALGAGVVLGMASPSLGVSGRSGDSRPQAFIQEQPSPAGQGIFGGLIASLEAMVVDEGRQLLEQWLAPARRRSDGVRDGSVPHV
jgi:hypothetical protein